MSLVRKNFYVVWWNLVILTILNYLKFNRVNKKSVATTTDLKFKDFSTPPPTPFVDGNRFYLFDRKRV